MLSIVIVSIVVVSPSLELKTHPKQLLGRILLGSSGTFLGQATMNILKTWLLMLTQDDSGNWKRRKVAKSDDDEEDDDEPESKGMWG